MVMAETRRRFDREFCEGAVRIVRETGKPIAHVARDLGINDGTLANWVAQDRRARGEAAAGAGCRGCGPGRRPTVADRSVGGFRPCPQIVLLGWGGVAPGVCLAAVIFSPRGLRHRPAPCGVGWL